MKDMDKYEDLEVWKAAMELVQEIYGLTEKFPPEEKPALAGHMRVAAIKIPSKIAASTGYKNMKISFWYLAIVHALLHTLETHLKTSVRLKYLPVAEAAPALEKCKKIGRMIDELMMA
jgi:four helix bundle protein